MRRVEKTVFISYRRADEAWALAIYNTLKQRGFDVFIDYLGIGSGSFEREILENIGARAHFLVLLTLQALDRVDEPNDWMRREIECAIDLRRNVIPVMLGKFRFDAPEVRPRLTGKLALLGRYNGLPVPAGYFEAAMERLERQFLTVEIDTVLHPLSVDAQQSASRQQAAADRATIGVDPRPEDLGLPLNRLGNTADTIQADDKRRAAQGVSDEGVGSRIVAAPPSGAPVAAAHPDLLRVRTRDDAIVGKLPRQAATNTEQVSPKIPGKISEASLTSRLIPNSVRLGVPLLVAAVSLVLGLGIYTTMAWKPNLLVSLNLVGNSWFALQFLGGLTLAACVSALFRSYAAYSGKTLGRTLEIGGPVVLLLAVVALGFGALPQPSPKPKVRLDPGTELSVTITAPAADKLHFATADTSGSAEWSIAIQPKLITSLAESLSRTWHDEDARTLASLLLPPELRTLVSKAGGTHLHLIVNQDTAKFPWEAVFGGATGTIVPVSVIRSLAGVTPPRVRHGAAATALLIGDPSTQGFAAASGGLGELPHLPGSRAETAEVAAILRRAGFSVVQTAEAPAGDLLRMFFHTDYRIVLLAAHGLYEYALPSGAIVTGVPLSDGVMITAQEFDQMNAPPDLVFLDASHLGRIGSGPDGEAALQRSLPVRLLRRGVRTVIALDWAVDDQAALEFSKTFFESLVVDRQTVEEAVLTARRQLHLRNPARGDWAAYQLYGVADYRMGAIE